ncbi:MAG: tRNA preQ1(34) S-adenosylmethionine ribosyltransferase-isomerase QueA, partial [Aerococcus viridans]
MTLTTNDFDFDLPEELIAQVPIQDRLASRLLKLDAQTGDFQDGHFPDVASELEAGDVLVLNNTRVLPARLHGIRPDTGGHIEVLLLNNTEGDKWETLVKPARRIRVGTEIAFGDGQLVAVVTEVLDHGG